LLFVELKWEKERERERERGERREGEEREERERERRERREERREKGRKRREKKRKRLKFFVASQQVTRANKNLPDGSHGFKRPKWSSNDGCSCTWRPKRTD